MLNVHRERPYALQKALHWSCAELGSPGPLSEPYHVCAASLKEGCYIAN
jgi:hypothetical protein